MPAPIHQLPQVAWSAPGISRVCDGRDVVALIGKRAQLVHAADGSKLGKPVGGTDPDWGLTTEDRLVRVDGGILATIDVTTGKPHHTAKAPGARRLVVAGTYVFAWGGDEVFAFIVRGDEPPTLAWSAPCKYVRELFIIGERVLIGGIGQRPTTVVRALADGHELGVLPGLVFRADDQGLVLDAHTAFVVMDHDGKTLWRASLKEFRADALMRDVVVANRTQADLQAGAEVLLERTTGAVRATLPEDQTRRWPPPFTSTQKVVAVADDTIYLAEGVVGRTRPICAYDTHGQLRWTLEVTLGANHHLNMLYAADRRLLALAGSGRLTCLIG